MFESPFMTNLSSLFIFLPSVHGEAGGAGLVGLLDNLLEAATRATDPGSSFRLFPGIQALGFNIHPMLVHFPIAFLSIFFLLDVAGFVLRSERLRHVASIVLYLGALGAVFAAAAGLYAASIVPHGQSVHEIMEWHERLGITVTALALILSVWRLMAKAKIAGMAQALHLFLSAIMTVCMIIGADLGGLMVYEHGVAVHGLQQPDAHHHHESPAQTDDSKFQTPSLRP